MADSRSRYHGENKMLNTNNNNNSVRNRYDTQNTILEANTANNNNNNLYDNENKESPNINPRNNLPEIKITNENNLEDLNTAFKRYEAKTNRIIQMVYLSAVPKEDRRFFILTPDSTNEIKPDLEAYIQTHNKTLEQSTPEGIQQALKDIQAEIKQDNLVSPQDKDEFFEKKILSAVIDAKCKSSKGLYNTYWFHGWLGLSGEVFFSYFLFALAQKFLASMLNITDQKVALPLSLTLTVFSFLANVMTVVPTTEAKKAMKASIISPDKTFLNLMLNNKSLTLAMIINFVMGAYADATQLNELDGYNDFTGPLGKILMTIFIIYQGFSYYWLYNAKDIFDAHDEWEGKESLFLNIFRKLDKGEIRNSLTSLYCLLLEFITVTHRSATFAYFGFQLPVQNGLPEIVGFLGAAIAFIATWPTAVYTKGKTLEDQLTTPLYPASNFSNALEIAKNAEANKSWGEFLFDEFKTAFLSPSPILTLFALYPLYEAVQNGTISQRQGYGLYMPLCFGVITKIYREIVAVPERIINKAQKMLKEQDKSKLAPNTLAYLIAFASNGADQLLRAGSFVPAMEVLAAALGIEATFHLKFYLFLVSLMLGAGNYPYQFEKGLAGLPEWWPALFAKNPESSVCTRIPESLSKCCSTLFTKSNDLLFGKKITTTSTSTLREIDLGEFKIENESEDTEEQNQLIFGTSSSSGGKANVNEKDDDDNSNPDYENDATSPRNSWCPSWQGLSKLIRRNN